jgi:S1-C subfamily serine protease
MRVVVLFSLAAASFAVEDLLQRLSTVTCTIKDNSFASPWTVGVSQKVQTGFMTEPYVITFADNLRADAKCKVQLSGSAHAWPLELVREDSAASLMVYSVKGADKAFWEGKGEIPRSGILRLGSHAKSVTGRAGLVGTETISAYGPAMGPYGVRLAASLEWVPQTDGFLFDEEGAFAGLLVGGQAIPEWTFGDFANASPRPSLGLSLIGGQNAAFRQRYGIPNTGGVLIVGAAAPWQQVVQPGDVLMSLDGEQVGHDGKVHSKDVGIRLPVQLVAQPHMKATVLHMGQEKEGEVELSVPAAAPQVETPKPSYLIVGGLLFAPFTPKLIQDVAMEQQLWVSDEVAGMLGGPDTYVALANVLPHPINDGFRVGSMNLLHSCNDKPVPDLKSLLKITNGAIEEKASLKCSFLRVSDKDDGVGVWKGESPMYPDFVFEAERLHEVQSAILDQYGVPTSMSTDLCGVAPALDEATEEECDSVKAALLHNATGHSVRIRAIKKSGSKDSKNSTKRLLLRAPKAVVDVAAVEKWQEEEVDRDDGKDLVAEIPGTIKLGDRDLGAKPFPWGTATWGKGAASSGVPLSQVVKIMTLSAGKNFLEPWKLHQKMRSSGSGILIKGEDVGVPGEKFVLTNAHVVHEHQVVFVQRQDMSRKILAEVRIIARDVDLALLRVPDEELWADVGELRVTTDIPVNSHVRVAGYPHGGNAVSITTGVVSRVMAMPYEFSQPMNPVNQPGNVVAMQVDAAINPGNSGGPVFNQDGEFLGLAFAGISQAQNMGFVIPAKVILARLPALHRDADAKIYRGIPEVGLLWDKLESDAMREYLKVPEEGGVIVSSVAPLGVAKEHVKKGDVLLAIDGQVVAGDGTVVMPGQGGEADIRVPLDALITEKPDNATTVLRLWTDEKVKDVKVDFQPVPPRVPRYDTDPSYVVIGGLVFSKFTVPYLNAMNHNVPPETTQTLDTWKENATDDVVVLVDILEDATTEFYTTQKGSRLLFLNFQPIYSLAGLIEQIPAALEAPFLEFSFDPSGFSTLILNSTLVMESTVREDHAVPSPVSPGLAHVWCDTSRKGRLPHWSGCD